MSQRTLPFIVTPETFHLLQIGDIVTVEFEDPDDKGNCHYHCGEVHRCFIIRTGTGPRRVKPGQPGSIFFDLDVNAIGRDKRNNNHTTFTWQNSTQKWFSCIGYNTLSTITVIGHMNNLPIDLITKIPVRLADMGDPYEL